MNSYDDEGLVTEVSLSSTTPPTSVDYLRMTTGERRRLSLVWLKADGSPKILAAPVQYFDGVGKVVSRAGKDGADADNIWASGEPARTSYATLVLVYPKGADGKLDRARLLQGVDVLRWTFAEKTLSNLQKMTSAGPLGKVDFWSTCADERYQRMEFARINGCLWWTDEEVRHNILRRASELEGGVSPARKLTTAELASKLGKSWPPEQDFSQDDMNADLSNLLDETGSV